MTKETKEYYLIKFSYRELFDMLEAKFNIKLTDESYLSCSPDNKTFTVESKCKIIDGVTI